MQDIVRDSRMKRGAEVRKCVCLFCVCPQDIVARLAEEDAPALARMAARRLLALSLSLFPSLSLSLSLSPSLPPSLPPSHLALLFSLSLSRSCSLFLTRSLAQYPHLSPSRSLPRSHSRSPSLSLALSLCQRERERDRGGSETGTEGRRVAQKAETRERLPNPESAQAPPSATAYAAPSNPCANRRLRLRGAEGLRFACAVQRARVSTARCRGPGFRPVPPGVYPHACD